jgi:formylmethanofuran dehydrogenase subunit D
MKRQFLLNTGSTIEEGRLAKGGSKMTLEYSNECAVCAMNCGDYESMGSPKRVRVARMDGKYSVVVTAVAAGSLMSGHVFMPRAVWANVVVEPDTFSTGSPLYKGSPISIEPTDDPVLSAKELVDELYLGVRK